MNTQKLKSLQVNQTRLDCEIKDLKSTIAEANKQLAIKCAQYNAISKEICELHSQTPVITEHALLRYVERILHIDLSTIKKEILSDANVKIIDELRSCKIPVNGKYKVVVKNKSVVTIEEL
jgi:hypothetical protein